MRTLLALLSKGEGREGGQQTSSETGSVPFLVPKTAGESSVFLGLVALVKMLKALPPSAFSKILSTYIQYTDAQIQDMALFRATPTFLYS